MSAIPRAGVRELSRNFPGQFPGVRLPRACALRAIGLSERRVELGATRAQRSGVRPWSVQEAATPHGSVALI